jgi:uncharacterized membrane protein
MTFMFGGLGLLAVAWSLLPLIALLVALRALRRARPPSRAADDGARLAAIEGRLEALRVELRELGQRLRALEGAVPGRAVAAMPGVAPVPFIAPPAPESRDLPLAPEVPPPPSAPPVTAEAPTPPRAMDLEQRIGARWATWVGIIAILFAASFFLRWAFEHDVIGPGMRVTLGLLAGAGLLGGGLVLGRRRDLPYLSEGLAGGGLGLLYLSIYAGYAFYAFVGAGLAFAAMILVTATGAIVSLVTSRQAIAVLSVLGGLLTPVLLSSGRGDERVLLGYLFVLDLMVLAVARWRTWPALDWLAWSGSALLLTPMLMRDPEPDHLLARLGLLAALFLLFLAVPVAREWTLPSRVRDVDVLFVVANAAAYFGAVYWTLEATRPAAEGPYALALAVLYAAVAAESRRRRPDDDAAALVHLGVADVFLTLGIALTIHGSWITMAWAAQGVVLLSVAPRVIGPVAVWGGLAALGLAVFRVMVADPYWYPEPIPRFDADDLVHGAVVGCLVWGGALARRVRPEQLRLLTPDGLRGLLWIAASLLAAALIWRETTGLWPMLLLSAEIVVLGGLARLMSEPRAPTFGVAVPLVALVLLARMLVEDTTLARLGAGSLVNGPLLARIVGCLAIALAGRALARVDAEDGAARAGRVLSATAGAALLIVLSLGWTDHMTIVRRGALVARDRDLAADLGWRTQVGLSVLWTLYAGAALAWGFVRRAPSVRYAALALLGVVIVKVFVSDLAAVATVYRIVSFLILGLVLLGVSFLYQKASAGR